MKLTRELIRVLAFMIVFEGTAGEGFKLASEVPAEEPAITIPQHFYSLPHGNEAKYLPIQPAKPDMVQVSTTVVASWSGFHESFQRVSSTHS